MSFLTKVKSASINNEVITAKEDIKKFKIDLMRKMPFYGDIIMKIPIVEDNSIPTAATNGKVIIYNSEYMNSISPAQRRFIIMHEVFHILLFHWKRNKHRIPIFWNVACDYVVNQMLTGLSGKFKENGIEIEKPEDVCCAQYCIFSAAEDVYYKVLEDNKDNDSKDKIYVRKVYSNLKNGQKELLDKSKFPKDLTVKLARNLSEEEQAKLELEVKNLVKDAATKNRSKYGSGEVPREILKFVESKMLPWNKYLSQFLTQVDGDEASYMTPERKYMHMDLIIPGLEKHREELCEVWAFVDSSGSVNQEELDQYLTQLYRISKQFGCEMNVAYWDTKVTDVYRRIKRPKELLNCMPCHSGGTDINCIYEYLEENKIKPYVMLILTDGFFEEADVMFKKKNKKKTIMVLTNKHKEDIESFKDYGIVATL